MKMMMLLAMVVMPFTSSQEQRLCRADPYVPNYLGYCKPWPGRTGNCEGGRLVPDYYNDCREGQNVALDLHDGFNW